MMIIATEQLLFGCYAIYCFIAVLLRIKSMMINSWHSAFFSAGWAFQLPSARPSFQKRNVRILIRILPVVRGQYATRAGEQW